MIQKHPWLVGIAFGGLIAIANAQTIGGFGGGGSSGSSGCSQNCTITETAGNSALTLSGATQTASNPVLQATQIWNNAGVAFTGWQLSVTNTASANTSKYLDIISGGSSKFSIVATSGLATDIVWGSGPHRFVDNGGSSFILSPGGTGQVQVNQFGALQIFSDVKLGASSNVIFHVNGAGSFQFGDADAASPVAQIVGAQSIAAGSSNASAANLTITNNAARGTGTGIGGAIVFQTAPVGLSSTNQNPLVPAFVIDGASHLRIGSMTAPSISSCGGGSPSVVGTDQGGIITFGTTATTCTLTWTNAYNSTPICTVDWQNNLASMNFTPSNTNLLLAQTSTSGNKAHYICFANKGG